LRNQLDTSIVCSTIVLLLASSLEPTCEDDAVVS